MKDRMLEEKPACPVISVTFPTEVKCDFCGASKDDFEKV